MQLPADGRRATVGTPWQIYAIIRPGQSRALLARFRTWINTRTDQVIIVGSLIIGLWLIADSIYLVIS